MEVAVDQRFRQSRHLKLAAGHDQRGDRCIQSAAIAWRHRAEELGVAGESRHDPGDARGTALLAPDRGKLGLTSSPGLLDARERFEPGAPRGGRPVSDRLPADVAHQQPAFGGVDRDHVRQCRRRASPEAARDARLVGKDGRAALQVDGAVAGLDAEEGRQPPQVEEPRRRSRAKAGLGKPSLGPAGRPGEPSRYGPRWPAGRSPRRPFGDPPGERGGDAPGFGEVRVEAVDRLPVRSVGHDVECARLQFHEVWRGGRAGERGHPQDRDLGTEELADRVEPGEVVSGFDLERRKLEPI